MNVIETDDPRVEAEFAALYEATHGRIVRYAARRIGPHDAEDVAAEVFRIAWTRTCEGVDVGTGWLFVTAENVLRNHVRSEVRARRTQPRDGPRPSPTTTSSTRSTASTTPRGTC